MPSTATSAAAAYRPVLAGGFTVEDLTPALLVGGIVLLLALVAVRVAARSGLPTLLLYLGIGLLLGEGGFGVRFDDAELTQVLGYCALVLILAEGGLTTRWDSIRRSVAPAAVLSTLGVLVSVLVVAAAGHWLLGMSWSVALVVGAVVSSTDAAAVFSVLRTVPLPRRLSGLLEAESGLNDPPVVILVTGFAVALVPNGHVEPWWQLLGLALLELAGGGIVGVVIGRVGGLVVRRLAGSSSGLFAIGVIGLAVLAYAVAAVLSLSGFIAAYLAALVLGNMGLPHRPAVHGLAEALGTLAQIGLFVLLGLLASPARLGGQIVPALVVGVVLVLLARPLSVLVALTPFRIPWRDQAFLSWAGLRGAVPVVLATVPSTLGARGTEWIFDLVFVLVVVNTLVQAPALPWVARRLGLIESVRQVSVELETTPLEQMDADVVVATVGPDSRLHGVEVFELRLPPEAKVTLIVRGAGSIVPTGRTRLRHGDQLLVVTTARARAEAEKRLLMVSRHGRLAGWSGRRGGASGDREGPPGTGNSAGPPGRS